MEGESEEFIANDNECNSKTAVKGESGCQNNEMLAAECSDTTDAKADDQTLKNY